MQIRMAFIMDPMEGILVDKDTSFVFMLEAQKRGHEIYHVDVGDLFIEGTQPLSRCRRVEVRRAQAQILRAELDQLGHRDHVGFLRVRLRPDELDR